MSQKVICDRAHLCKEDYCEHQEPHEIEVWNDGGYRTPVDCTHPDECDMFKSVRCVSYNIDFEIEELFDL